MPIFGAEYNAILNNLATLYDLRQEKIEIVKINKRIDQVSSMIKHPLVQDATGVIHSYNTSTGVYMPVSVLPVAELPNPAHYQNGAIVSVAGVLYVQKSGEWEGVGGASEYITEVHEWRLDQSTWPEIVANDVEILNFENQFVDKIECYVYFDDEIARADADRITGGQNTFISRYKSSSFIASHSENTQIQSVDGGLTGIGVTRSVLEVLMSNPTIRAGSQALVIPTEELVLHSGLLQYIYTDGDMSVNIRLVITKVKPLTPVQTIEEEPKK